MSDQLTITVAGLGRMGKRHVHTLLYRVLRARVVAVCSTVPDEVEWAKGNEEYKEFRIAVYSNYIDMLAHQGLQVVWVSTSTDVHASQTLAAAQSVVDTAKENPELKVMTGFSRRFDASYRDASDKIFQGNAIGSPFIVRSNTCDLRDDTGFFVRYTQAAMVACWAPGTLQHHPELEVLSDVDNAVGIVESRDGKIAYFYCSRAQAHGHDVRTEVTGTDGKIMVNVMRRHNHVVVADKLGMRNEVPPGYWQRFEDAFAVEANEFTEAVLKKKTRTSAS